MKKIIFPTCILAIVLLCAAPCLSKENKDRYTSVNMEQVTCNDVMNEKDLQKVKAVLIWIDGYLSAQANDMTVDIYELENLAKSLEGYCRANPSSTIMRALKKTKKAGKY